MITKNIMIKIIVNLFIKREIVSVETILSAYTHTNAHAGASTHDNTDYTKLNLHTTLKV